MANALWGQKDFGWRPDFLGIMNNSYRAGFHETDFAANPEQAREAINAWGAKQTRGMIKDLLQPGQLQPLTVLVLANAFYFNGFWQEPFYARGTHLLNFYRDDTDAVKVPLMYVVGSFRYAEAKDHQVLELPYKGGDLAMVLVLPNNVKGLADMEKRLSAARCVEAIKSLKMEPEVRVHLPRFRIATEIKLNDMLARLGMKTVFARGQADLSGMAGRRSSCVGCQAKNLRGRHRRRNQSGGDHGHRGRQKGR